MSYTNNKKPCTYSALVQNIYHVVEFILVNFRCTIDKIAKQNCIKIICIYHLIIIVYLNFFYFWKEIT